MANFYLLKHIYYLIFDTTDKLTSQIFFNQYSHRHRNFLDVNIDILWIDENQVIIGKMCF